MSLHHMLRAAAGSAPSDPYFENVTLLLTGDGTNGAQNNTFLDSSTNNFTITRNGNTTQGTFSPYGNLWSNYFVSGTNTYLSTSGGAATAMGTGDFTWECFVYILGTSAYQDFIDTRSAPATGSSDGFAFALNNGTLTPIIYTTGILLSSSVNITANAWNHVAVTRSGTTLTLWVNGVSGGSITNSTNLSNQSLSIGSANTTSVQTNGYISNVRIVKGTALYTSNFTPSTTPLTAVSGTSLLTCQSNRFIDNSSNNFTLTVNGNTSVQRFSPFNPTAPYSTSTIGGSGYFDGSGDYLTVGSNAVSNFGTSDFTFECWLNTNVSNTTIDVVYTNNNGTANGAALQVNRSSAGSVDWYNGNTNIFAYAANLQIGSWYHVAVCRSGTTNRLFINGVQVASVTDSSNYASGSASSTIGVDTTGSYEFNGYISNLRVVKGTAVYTSNFTPPTTPLTAITNTSLLCNFTNAGIPDAAMMNDLETVGNAQVSTSVKKYGTGSLAFDGTGDWLSLPANNNFYFGTGDFTVEFWLNTSVGNQGIVDQWLNGSGSYTIGQWQIGMDASTRYLNFYVATGASAVSSFSTSSAPASGQWVHVAFVRSSNVVKCYIDGTANANTLSFSGTVGVANSKSSIGVQTNNSTLPFQGYIDDLRITKGYARYTSNFTPPTAALPVY